MLRRRAQVRILLRLRKFGQRLECIQQGVLARLGEAQLPQQDVGAAREAMQRAAQRRQHEVRRAVQAALDLIEDGHVHRPRPLRDEFRRHPPQFALGRDLGLLALSARPFQEIVQLLPILDHAVLGETQGQIRHEAFFHELEELVARAMHQLLRLHLAHQLPLAFVEFGDHVREIRHDALGVLVRIEQVIHLSFVLFEERTQGAAGIAGVAMAGAEPAARQLGHGLGEHAAHPGETIGTGQRDLVRVQFQPAVFQQYLEYPNRLLALVANRRGFLVIRLVEHRAARDRFLENLEHQFAADHSAIVRHGTVETRVEFPQASRDLLAVLARQRAEEMQSIGVE